jgi:hypothetical protein
MDDVRRYSSFIKRIVTARINIRKKLLKSSNLAIIKAICELLLNILQKNISTSKLVIKQLKKHKKTIYKLLDKSTSLEAKKAILIKTCKLISPLSAVFK